MISIVSGFTAAVEMTLYVSSEKARRLYVRPDALLALFPLLLYWVSRIWFYACRGGLREDPVLFAVRDRVSWALAIAAAGVWFLASLGWWPAVNFEW